MIQVNIDIIKDDIIKMYTCDNMNTVQIANTIGCCNSAVGSLLRKYGVPKHSDTRPSKLDADQIQEACKMYEQGMTTVEIAKVFGVTDHTIAKHLCASGVALRRAVHRSSVSHHDYFAAIDTAEKAYFLGWMITDGSIVTSRLRPDRSPTISIEIHNRDRYIIERFAHELGATSENVKVFVKRDHCYFRFASQEMADNLAAYGVVKNKTYSAYLPVISENLMPHLIRGIFDGNGTVTVSNKDGHLSFALYGTKELCSQTRDYLASACGMRVPPIGVSTCHHVWWCSRRDAALFYEYIYKDANDLCLTRKKEKFEKFLF